MYCPNFDSGPDEISSATAVPTGIEDPAGGLVRIAPFTGTISLWLQLIDPTFNPMPLSAPSVAERVSPETSGTTAMSAGMLLAEGPLEISRSTAVPSGTWVRGAGVEPMMVPAATVELDSLDTEPTLSLTAVSVVEASSSGVPTRSG